MTIAPLLIGAEFAAWSGVVRLVMTNEKILMEVDMRKGLWLAGLALAIIAMAAPANALPIVGDVSVTFNFKPVCGLSYECDLATATGLDILQSVGEVSSPGVPGEETVTSGTGDFSGLPLMGTMKDFSFQVGSASADFPYPEILAWETIGGLTFDLLTVHVATQNSMFLNLYGTGMFHLAGFEDTPGTFTMSGNQAGKTFSASASKGTVDVVPDAGSSLLLLGMGLVGLRAWRKRQ
jgi:hypothetical protein